jgi:hypothetical protein
MGTYGTDGYELVGGPSSLPSYATVSAAGNSTYTWSSDTSDVRALENPKASRPNSNRIAAAWYAANRFTVTVGLSASAHTLALYAVAWAGHSRRETIQISDASSGKVLDTETLSSFHGGVYEEWNVSGHIKITITKRSGTNTILNGLFFSTPTPTPTPTETATFVKADTTTRANRMGTLRVRRLRASGRPLEPPALRHGLRRRQLDLRLELRHDRRPRPGEPQRLAAQ